MDWEDGGWFQWIEIEIEGVAGGTIILSMRSVSSIGAPI